MTFYKAQIVPGSTFSQNFEIAPQAKLHEWSYNEM